MVHEEEEVLRKEGSADKTVIMLHGRGATAHSIMQLEKQLPKAEYVAPQAADNTWYPRSFMEPVGSNQPHLDSALRKVHGLVEEAAERVGKENAFLLGFSQGACLASEYVARNPDGYGGVIVFSGGLIGERVREHKGDMEGTPVFIGCSENDPHIPLERVDRTAQTFEGLGADMEKHVFEGSYHGITEYELDAAESIIGRSKTI